MSRLVVGNLDCEDEWFTEKTGRPLRQLRRVVLEKISGLATLLRVFASDDDALWTPSPVDPNRIPEATGPRPSLVSGALPEAKRPLLAWGETASVEARRENAVRDRVPPDAALRDAVWSLPTTSPTTARVCNDRKYSARLSGELCAAVGCYQPFAVDHRTLMHTASAAYQMRQWVLKSPLSAAGRDRLVGAGAPDRESWEAYLASQGGELTLEPLVHRVADFGIAGLLGDRDIRWFDPHGLRVNDAGKVMSIVLPVPGERPHGLDAKYDRDFRDLSEQVGERLRSEGYRGPFGLDGWIYHDEFAPPAPPTLQPLGEINARLTFGLVARAWEEWWRETHPGETWSSFELHLGAPEETPAGATVLPLLYEPDLETPAAALVVVSGERVESGDEGTSHAS